MRNKILQPQTIIPTDLYVNRDADRQLAVTIGDMGRPAYILVARQMGKTNLLLNAKRNCKITNDIFVYQDLSKAFEDSRDCFREIADTTIQTCLAECETVGELSSSVRGKNLPAYKEHEHELRNILANIPGKLVIALDEIDSLTNASFSDQIFAHIRSVYFSRINIPEYSKLTYVLSGVVDPNEIIKDKRISPFNIGQKIYLNDFTYEEFVTFLEKSKLPLTEQVKESIYGWTRGNPRISWDLCSNIEDVYLDRGSVDLTDVDRVVQELYFNDFNRAPVDHIRELVASEMTLRTAVRHLQSGQAHRVTDDVRKRLYLSGIIGPNLADRAMEIKNPIIARALSEQWLSSLSLKSKEVLRAADDLYEEGRYKEALSLYERYRREDGFSQSTEAAYLYKLGLCHYRLKQYDSAIDCFSASNPNPKESASLYFQRFLFLGTCLIQVHRLDEAIKNLREAASPESSAFPSVQTRAMINLAWALNESDPIANRSEAIEMYSNAIEVCDPSDQSPEGGHSLLSFAYYQIGMLLRNTDLFRARKNLSSAYAVAAAADKPQVGIWLLPLINDAAEKASLLDEIVNHISSNAILPGAVDPEVPLVLKYDSCLLLLSEAYTVDRSQFTKLTTYLLQTPSMFSGEADLLFQVAIYEIQEKHYQRAITFLKQCLSIASNERLLYNVHRYISVLSSPREAKYHFLEYFRLFKQIGGSEELSLVDFRVFENYISFSIEHDALSTAMEWITGIKGRIPNTDEALLRNYAAIFYYEMRVYEKREDRDLLEIAARNAITFIDQLPTDCETRSILDDQQLKNISDYARSASGFSSVLTPYKRGPKIGRNDKVSVRYANGKTILSVKYKKVSNDLQDGLCVIIENGGDN